METREQFEFENLGDRQTGRYQARQTIDTVRPFLEKQTHPEYDQNQNLGCLYVARLAHSREHRFHQIDLCVSFGRGNVAVYALDGMA